MRLSGFCCHQVASLASFERGQGLTVEIMCIRTNYSESLCTGIGSGAIHCKIRLPQGTHAEDSQVRAALTTCWALKHNFGALTVALRKLWACPFSTLLISCLTVTKKVMSASNVSVYGMTCPFNVDCMPFNTAAMHSRMGKVFAQRGRVNKNFKNQDSSSSAKGGRFAKGEDFRSARRAKECDPLSSLLFAELCHCMPLACMH